jgi:hypothetical protein
MRLSVVLSFLMLINFSSFSSFGQSQPREFNRIILWDVTASMVGSTPNGYNAATDIDKNVREGLRNLINTFKDDNSTFRILPFTTDIIDFSKTFSSNPSGKQQALNYINSYVISREIKGYTNICAAWEKANSYVDRGKSNFIFLYTDGEQNINYGKDGLNCMQGLIDKYCDLTKGASFSYVISINANNRFHFPPECGLVITRPGDTPPPPPHSLNLTPLTNSILINLQEGLTQTLRFRENGDRKLGNNFVVSGKVVFSNPAYSFDVQLNLKKEYDNGTADFEVKFVDFSNKTVPRMQQVAHLSETATLTLESADKEVKFEPTDLQVIFKYERPKPVQKVNIKID